MACTSSKTLDSLVPQEAKSALLANAISGSALWSLQKNPGIGIHFTLFWPTDVPAEDLQEVAKLTGEEKKLVTQSPGLLSFILKKKKEELVSRIGTEKIGNKRNWSESPKNEIEESEEPAAKKTFSNDSGTSSPTEKIQKNILQEEEKTKEFPEEIKTEAEQYCSQESASEKAEEISTEVPTPPTAFPYPPSAFQSPLASPSFHPSTLIQNIQNQIFQAAIQRRKLLEDEQKRILCNFQTSGGANFNPSSTQNLNQQRASLPMPLGIPPNALAIFGNNAPRFQMPPTSFAGLTHSDIGLPREGEAVFRDKYIWSDSVKKYLCSVCGYSTPYRSNIIVHLPKHYPELRRFRCPICSKRYGRKDLWKSHLRSRHPEVADIILSPTWHSAQPNQLTLKSTKPADALTKTQT